MTFTDNQKYIVAGVLIVTAFAIGRYSNRSLPSTSDTNTTKVDTNKNQDTETHTQTTETTTKKPDGTTTTVTQTNTVISDKTKTKIDDTSKTVDISTPPKASILNVSALVSPGFQDGMKMAYGVSMTKEVLGPITVGAFGLTNGVIGVSVGLDF